LNYLNILNGLNESHPKSPPYGYGLILVIFVP
jgi:hypothetical protein